MPTFEAHVHQTNIGMFVSHQSLSDDDDSEEELSLEVALATSFNAAQALALPLPLPPRLELAAWRCQTMNMYSTSKGPLVRLKPLP